MIWIIVLSISIICLFIWIIAEGIKSAIEENRSRKQRYINKIGEHRMRKLSNYPFPSLEDLDNLQKSISNKYGVGSYSVDSAIRFQRRLERKKKEIDMAIKLGDNKVLKELLKDKYI